MTRVTEHLGLIYAVNTLGAILGSLLAGFVLVPAIGLHLTIRVVAAIGALTAIAILVAARRARAAASLGFALAGVVPSSRSRSCRTGIRSLLSSGAYKYAPAMRGPNLETALTAGELLSYREGSTGTVAVRRLTGTISLAIDGKVDASNAGDMLTQRLLAHVPLLLHPESAARGDPRARQRRHARLGAHAIRSATPTVLEISPEVVAASRFFEAENHRALADPRTRLSSATAART